MLRCVLILMERVCSKERSSIKGSQQKFLLHSTFNDYILLLVPSHKNGWCGMKKRRSKKERQELLQQTIETNPFITDEDLAEKFQVSIQTVRLDRMELSIPELRERIKHVATKQHEEDVKSLPLEEVVGEIIDIELDRHAISIFEVKIEHVFKRNQIARGHHLFAQANSLAVAVIDEELALTAKSTIRYIRPVKLGERVVAKARVEDVENDKGRTVVKVHSFVGEELVFTGTFEMYRSSNYSEEGNNL